jgi:hypothetical protein
LFVITADPPIKRINMHARRPESEAEREAAKEIARYLFLTSNGLKALVDSIIDWNIERPNAPFDPLTCTVDFNIRCQRAFPVTTDWHVGVFPFGQGGPSVDYRELEGPIITMIGTLTGFYCGSFAKIRTDLNDVNCLRFEYFLYNDIFREFLDRNLLKKWIDNCKRIRDEAKRKFEMALEVPMEEEQRSFKKPSLYGRKRMVIKSEPETAQV